MVLSNAERQARYRQRLKDAAERGVTPDMVVKAARLLFENEEWGGDPSMTWEEYALSAKAKSYWSRNLPNDPDMDYSDFGEDAELMRKVAAVVRAVLLPPSA